MQAGKHSRLPSRRLPHRRRFGGKYLVPILLVAVIGTGAGVAATIGSASAGNEKPPRLPAPGEPAASEPVGPTRADFADIRTAPRVKKAPQRGRDASTGTFTMDCGRNTGGHRNPDNFITAPGVNNGAHHMHDYVGNESTDGFSTNDNLQAAGTTCEHGDKSTYFWPVLRVRGDDDPPDPDGNEGTILTPASVRLRFGGNVKGPVTAMPKFLRIITGDAKAFVNGPTNARASWSCTGFADRSLADKYPRCPSGSRVVRVLEFPSCWDGKNVDSPNHRGHMAFPALNGACGPGTKAVPHLTMTLTYKVPVGALYALDTFPQQVHKAMTDHGDFANVMPAGLMDRMVSCINQGQRCD